MCRPRASPARARAAARLTAPLPWPPPAHCSYESFRTLVERDCKPDDRILVLGCGNSSMSEGASPRAGVLQCSQPDSTPHADLFRLSGFKHVCSTDASPTVVEKMRARAAANGCGAITWCVADMLALPFPDASFDVAIEKGSLDCFLVDNHDPWNVAPEVRERVATALREAHRVLTPTGALLSITFSAPHFRKPLLGAGRFTWRCTHDVFGSDWHYYYYLARKGLKSESDDDDAPLDTAAESVRSMRSLCRMLRRAPLLTRALVRSQQLPGESMLHEHMDDASCLLGMMLDDDGR